jgi:hypothetical protein
MLVSWRHRPTVGQRINRYSSIVFDGGVVRWTATVGATAITLKEAGRYDGELEDNRARKLVSMMGQWCPDAADAFVSAEQFRLVLSGPPPPIIMRRGTAQEARAMLERAVSELKSDPTAALEQFAEIIWYDLFVFCATSDGELVSYPKMFPVFKEKWAEKFKNKILQYAVENEITQFTYADIKERGGPEVPKDAYITKASDHICGVGFFN